MPKMTTEACPTRSALLFLRQGREAGRVLTQKATVVVHKPLHGLSSCRWGVGMDRVIRTVDRVGAPS